MNKWRSDVIAAAALVSGVLAAAPAHAQQVGTHDAGTWKVAVPSGWRQLPEDAVKEIEAQAKAIAPMGNYRYVAVFCRNPEGAPAPPFVIVQVMDFGNQHFTYDEIEKGFKSGTTQPVIDEIANRAGTKAEASGTTLDRATNRLITNLTMNSPNGMIKATLHGFMGAHRIVQFNCYSTPAAFSGDQPLFNALLDGFSFSPGEEYSLAAARGAKTGRVIGWAVGGAVGALVIGGIRKLMRR